MDVRLLVQEPPQPLGAVAAQRALHVHAAAQADDVFGRVVADLGLTGQIAADQDGYPGILGYQGPALSAITTTSQSGRRK